MRWPGLMRGSTLQLDHPASCPGRVAQPCHLRDPRWAGMAPWTWGEKVNSGFGGESRKGRNAGLIVAVCGGGNQTTFSASPLGLLWPLPTH